MSENSMDLSPEALDLVRRRSAGAHIASDEPGASELARLGLAVSDGYTGGYALADLSHARRRLVADQLDQIGHHQAQIADIESLFVRLEASARQEGGGVHFFEKSAGANATIASRVDGAQSEILTAHPDARSRPAISSSLSREISALHRGVKWRTIYPDSSRAREAERDWVGEISKNGGQVATMAPRFFRMIIVDEDFAVVPDLRPGDKSLSAGCIVTHPGVVAILKRVFDDYWERAEPWSGERTRPESGAVTNQRSRQILRSLERGHTVARIANDLRLSRQTIQKEISALYEATGTDNQFSLGGWWACSEERRLP
ncbi:hypothetical protein ACFY5K_25795 [Streptomyces griseofuscus]|uniref:hypothetical protein n=1 Tax=Streptomyces griseofuscus TaxID=146922 RepID=UPI00369FCF47